MNGEGGIELVTRSTVSRVLDRAFTKRTLQGRVALAIALQGEMTHARRLLVTLRRKLRQK